MKSDTKLGFGGGCHWCTEAVFSFLKGVHTVDQGFISSIAPWDSFSEGVIVHFDPKLITYDILIDIHLKTHSAYSAHSMRKKYRSAIYYLDSRQKKIVEEIVGLHSAMNTKDPIVKIIPLADFNSSPEQYHDYYKTDPERPFCQNYIQPKLDKLRYLYPDYVIS